ncbi:unnamed protein product [Owenia fusiformis]|uniref:Uncharacterized protein n=1 Tax=Owenia fusiformis TaxID=6347 RepID=A0A8J1YC58_OWEFU|nr:unnamed protein product [Owenia fusiformis]
MGRKRKISEDIEVDVEVTDPPFEVDVDDSASLSSPHKKHKKHKKKHKKKKDETSFSSEPSSDLGSSPATPSKPSIKLKIKLGGKTLTSKDVPPPKAKEQANREGPVADNEPDIKTKSKGDDTSDEEEVWLKALEKGELDDYGRVKADKDLSLMTARQRAMIVGQSEAELMQLPTGYKKSDLTDEQKERRKQRADKRKVLAHEKREKDKKQTIDRLLKKQESKQKSTKARQAGKKAQKPHVRYLRTLNQRSISLPPNVPFPLKHQPPINPPKQQLCGLKGCKNARKYSCSKTGLSLCGLECYNKNKSANKHLWNTVR